MKISFLVARTNSLYYYIPLVEFLCKENFILNFLLLDGTDKKYNSIGRPENKNATIKILEDKKFQYSIINSSDEIINLNIDILISLEGNGVSKNFSQRKFKHIILQNYHDSTFSMQYPPTEYIYENSDVFWVSPFLEKFFLKLNYKGKIFSEIKSCYWNYFSTKKDNVLENLDKNLKTKFSFDLHQKEKKIALCFLPRPDETIMDSWKEVKYTPCDTFHSGDPQIFINHALEFSEFLKDNGHYVIFKQRRKNRNPGWQNIKNYIEDNDIVFPNLSLDLLYVADIAYGYTTSAVLDAFVLNKKYYNFINSINSYPTITKEIFDLYQKNININIPFKEIDLTTTELPKKSVNNIKIKFLELLNEIA